MKTQLLLAASLALTLFSAPTSFADVQTLNPESSTFETADHIKVKAQIYNAGSEDKKPVALLLPMVGKKRTSFDSMIEPLVKQGFAVVALDFRGQGASRRTIANKKFKSREFNDDEWNKLPGDVEQIIDDLQYVKGLDCKRIYIVGAALGANTAVVVGSTIGSSTTATIGQPELAVKGLVLLSPGLNIKGMRPDEAMMSFARPVYILVGEDDGYALDSSRRLAEMSRGHATLEVLPGYSSQEVDKIAEHDKVHHPSKDQRKKSHGSNLLTLHPELADKIAVWMKAQEAVH